MCLSSLISLSLSLSLSLSSIVIYGLFTWIDELTVHGNVYFLQSWCKASNKFSGTTALGAFIIGSRLTVYCIGDSMAVLCSQGKAVVMSDAHKPDRLDEQMRIKRANGWITEER
jgi:serine/threonine protein phosphatase PrpC